MFWLMSDYGRSTGRIVSVFFGLALAFAALHYLAGILNPPGVVTSLLEGKEGKMSYELANGQVKEYPYGLARVEFMGETTAGRVIFGEPGSEPLLGVTALESVGIVVDPANKTLRRLPAIPLKALKRQRGDRP